MTFSSAISDARDKGLEPKYVGIVQEISLAENAVDLIMVCTTPYLLFYQISDSKMLYQFSWLELSDFKYSSYNIQLCFGNTKFNCFSEEINQILMSISQSIQQILKPNELISLGFTPYKNLVFEPTTESILSRASLFCQQKNIEWNHEIQTSLTDFLIFSQTFVSIRQFSQKSIFPILCDILPLIKNVVSVELAKIQGFDLFHQASYISREKSNLQHIHINGKATGSFNSYLNHLMKNNNINLQGLTFSNSAFSDSQLNHLKEVVIAKEIRSLGFQKAILDENMKYFCNEFINSRIGDILVYLNLDFSSNIRLSLIFPNIPNIRVLSLEKCDLDIADVLSSISKYKLDHLTSINLSANNNIDVASLDSIVLPPNLESICVDNIEWMDEGLTHFFKMLENNFQEKSVRLSVINAKSTQNDWDFFFNFLQQSNLKTICSLVWDRNPVNKILFDFLLNCQDLSYLSVNYCFKSSSPEIVQNFADFISNSPNLGSLSIRGRKYMVLESLISVIVEAVMNSSIYYLDISYNGGGDDSIIFVQDLLDSNLQVLVADGLYPESLPVFKEFLENASNSSVFLSFPLTDAIMIASQSEEDKDNLLLEFYHIMNLNASDDDSINSLLLFLDEREPRFPSYIDSTGIVCNLDMNKRLFEMSYAKSAEIFNFTAQPTEDIVIQSPTKEYFSPYKTKHRKQRMHTRIDWTNAPQSPRMRKHVSIFVNENDDDYVAPMSSKRRNRSVPLSPKPIDQVQEAQCMSDGGDISNMISTMANAGDLNVEPPTLPLTSNLDDAIPIKSLRERKKHRKSPASADKWTFPIPQLPSYGEEIWEPLETEFSFENVFDSIKDDKPFEIPRKKSSRS